MEKNMDRQICPESLTPFLQEIVTFLGTIPTELPYDELCALLPGEAADAEEFLNDLAGCIEAEFLLESLAPFAFRAQIERLVCIIRLLATRVRGIACPEDDRCMDLVYEILCVVAEAFAILVGILVKLILLDGFLGDNDIFFECLVCNLIPEITCLEEAVKDISCLLVALISCDVDNGCTPCYVATKAGKRPKPVINKNICVNKKDCTCKKSY